MEKFYSNEINVDDEGRYHSENGPAFISITGDQYYIFHGQFHRIDGPAIVNVDRPNSYYLYGVKITSEVKEWMDENNISFPVSDDNLLLFKLRWC